jgi:hypothetical protein
LKSVPLCLDTQAVTTLHVREFCGQHYQERLQQLQMWQTAGQRCEVRSIASFDSISKLLPDLWLLIRGFIRVNRPVYWL